MFSKHLCYFSYKYLKTFSAATAHSAQATISCLNPQFPVEQSHTANTPGKFVLVQESTIIYHFSFFCKNLSKPCNLFGVIPIAINTQSNFKFLISLF
jgi:hypothetical protein